jgi:hypothetical protein
VPDIAHELAFEVRHRGKDAPGDHITFDLGEPELNLVEPGGIRWGEVQLHPGILGEECLDPCRLMRREIIRNHMDLFACRLVRHEVGQEGDKLG